jgi:Fe-S-cluster containining protein
MKEEKKSPLVWYQEGLRFKCTQCGKCCTGSPGYIWVSDKEIEEMAKFLNLSIEKFKRLYVKRRDNRYLLIEKKSQDHACIFFKDKQCQVYAARPTQCRTYPFWKENLVSEQSWQLTAETCEGIREDSSLISYSEIQQTLVNQEEEK